MDEELAAFWTAMFLRGQEKEMEGGGVMVIGAGLRAAPYLLRLHKWREAAMLLENVIGRDHSPGRVATVMPMMRRIADATRDTEEELAHRGVLAKALQEAGQTIEAEAELRDIIKEAARRGEYQTASSSIGDLCNLLLGAGRTSEALALMEDKKGYTQ